MAVCDIRGADFDNSLSIDMFHHQARVESHQGPVGDAGGQMVRSDAVAPTVNLTCSGGAVETGKMQKNANNVVNLYLHL